MDAGPSWRKSPSTRRNSMNILETQEVCNICMEAYKEVMERAWQLNTWVSEVPVLGSTDEIQHMFRSPPQPGKRVEATTASARVPIDMDGLASMMMNAREWAESQLPIVTCSNVPHEIVNRLKEADPRVTNAQKMQAIFKLPTPFVPTREFYFLRFQKQIMPLVYAFADVSGDYFPGGLEQECQRRPSGVIVRKVDNNCEVVWIENVEVPVPEDNIYFRIINENLAFCAQHWVSRLLQWLNSHGATFTNAEINVHNNADTSLLGLTRNMKFFYMGCSNYNPLPSWFSTTVGEGKLRVLKNNMVRENNAYISVTSFCVQVKPLSVFRFLVKRNLQLQGPQLPNSEQPKELLKFATDDDGHCITLNMEEMGQVLIMKSFGKFFCPFWISAKGFACIFFLSNVAAYTYRLQVASRDEFCSFILSAPMSEQDINDFMGLGSDNLCAFYRTSGFAIMPDGPGGLQSDGSVVTIAFQQHFQERAPYTCAVMVSELCNAVNAIIQEINEEVAGGDNH